MARDDPSTFVRVAASILPKHIEHQHSVIDELRKLSADELRERLDELERPRAKLDTLH